MTKVALTPRPTIKLAAVLLVALLGACDTPTEPDEVRVPSVAGTWFGTFSEAPVRMDLQQSGDRVTGILVTARGQHDVNGVVNELGVFTWTTPFDAVLCVAYGSSRGMILGDGGNALAGAVRRSSRSHPCVEPGGRTLVQQGIMDLSRP